MELKDHYAILELEPSATTEEVKRAYRKLAHQFHPDKTSHDPYASAKFAAIKEAYETLMNPIRKEQYLQQRWYFKSRGGIKKQEPLTPVSLLKRVLDLDRYVSKLDVHRMDKVGLHEHLLDLLSESNIDTVLSFNDPSVNDEIVIYTLRISRMLHYKQILTLTSKWKRLTVNADLIKNIEAFTKRQERSARWDKYRIFILFGLVIIICFLIFIITN